MNIIYAHAQGVHSREIKGLDQLRLRLPSNWYAFANLELLTPGQGGRQIDVAVVLDDRIILVDLKDWHGRLSSDGYNWLLNDQIMERSPVIKIAENARMVANLLVNFIKKILKNKQDFFDIPYIDSCVVMTGECSIVKMNDGEKSRIFSSESFCKIITDLSLRNSHFKPQRAFVSTHPLVGGDGLWRQRLSSFFTGNSRNFRPQEKIYAGYKVTSEVTYCHPSSIYAEYECLELNTDRSSGLLRLWDFSKAPTKYTSEEYRKDIAGREQRVVAMLIDSNQEIENTILRPKALDNEYGMRFWEIFEKRRQLKRLDDILQCGFNELNKLEKIDILKVLISSMADIHRLGVAHMDLGRHSIWIERPATLRISHFLAAHYNENRSLEGDRYQFLANKLILPEDILDGEKDYFARDVFMLGMIAHLILFGKEPDSTSGNPPEWSQEVDHEKNYSELYSWFECAFNIDVSYRFKNAQEMLDSLNKSLANIQDTGALVSHLQKYRTWNSIFQVLNEYPYQNESVKDDDRVQIYYSFHAGNKVVVKIWRSLNWKDEATDASKLLEFLERAELLKFQPVENIYEVLDFGYLGDHLVLVTKYTEGEKISSLLEGKSITRQNALEISNQLLESINKLHELEFGHGDLSPENIIITNENNRFYRTTIIDVLEFGSQRLNPAYSPSYPTGCFERDHFAVAKIIQEILFLADFTEIEQQGILNSIKICCETHPRLATLQPLKDEIEKLTNLSSPDQIQNIKIGMIGLKSTQVILPDEGKCYLRINTKSSLENTVSIYGSNSELLIFLDKEGNPINAKFRLIEQSKIAMASKHADTTLDCSFELVPSFVWDMSELEIVFEKYEIKLLLGKAKEGKCVQTKAQQEVDTQSKIEIADEDLGFNEDNKDDISTCFDIHKLWKELIDIEKELCIEVTAEEDSQYSHQKKRHYFSYSKTNGVIDFDKNEIVEAKLQKNKKNEWVTLGRLDVENTNNDIMVIDATRSNNHNKGFLCKVGSTIRLESVQEVDSRTRRDKATKRILAKNSVIKNLIDYIDPSAEISSTNYSKEPSNEFLYKTYGLNPSQAESFRHLWVTGPVGLLQGPPGTGKTKFIAAFIHYALTEGMMRNVLLASQSHEAVNNVAESIMDIFRKYNTLPSLVRVGQEGVVSDKLKPYHSAHVENLYRQRFKTKLKDNYFAAAKRLFLPEDFTEDFYIVSVSLRPILRQISNLLLASTTETVAAETFEQRLSTLQSTANRIGEALGLGQLSFPDDYDDVSHFDAIVHDLAKRYAINNNDHVKRMKQFVKITEDWIGHVGNRRRNFEEFLVNTRNIVCGTCVGLGRASLGVSNTIFDLVVIDEAARCTPSELAVPLQSGKRVLLVGDHLQLEPFYDPIVVKTAADRVNISLEQVRESDFKRAFNSTFGKRNGQTLKIQYRMLPPIGKLISKAFYEPQVVLKHGRNTPILPDHFFSNFLKEQITWIDTSRLGNKAYQLSTGSPKKSLSNTTEANIIVKILTKIDETQGLCDWFFEKTDKNSYPIGIICGYSGQKELLARKVAASGISSQFRSLLKIDTIDSYQGKQNLIIIVSLVRNNSDGYEGLIRQGFMCRANRLNVAFSRARDKLIIVGNASKWPEDSPMSKVAKGVSELQSEGAATILDVNSIFGD